MIAEIFLLSLQLCCKSANAQSSAFHGTGSGNDIPPATVTVAVLTDPFKSTDSVAAFSQKTAKALFATALQYNNRTVVRDYLSTQTIIGKEPTRRQVVVKPLFMAPGESRKMIQTMKDAHDPVVALLEMSGCSSTNCDQLNLVARDMPEVTVFSTCCYVWSKTEMEMFEEDALQTQETTTVSPDEATSIATDDDEAEVGLGNMIYLGLDPHDVCKLMLSLTRTYGWRHFHFLISPHWDVFDHFYKVVERTIAENGSNIILASSFYCSEYLAKGRLCEEDQARSIVLKQTTVLMMLLEKSHDLPAFLEQLYAINREELLAHGKAFFIINHSGMTMLRADSRLLDKAPDGLMVVRRLPHSFDFDTANYAMALASKWDMYTYFFQFLRLILKATEAYMQQPDYYDGMSDLFCNTVYYFDDSHEEFIYPVPCGTDFANLQLLNIHRDLNSSEEMLQNMAVLHVTNLTIRIINTPVWVGSGEIPPKEDFCLLDGSDCPPEPPNYPAIIAPSIVGFFVLFGITAGIIVAYLEVSRRQRKQADQLFAEIVAVFEEIEFQDTKDESNSNSGVSSGSDSRPSSGTGSSLSTELQTPLPVFSRAQSRAQSVAGSGRLIGSLAMAGHDAVAKLDDDQRRESNGELNDMDRYGEALKVRFRGDWAQSTRYRKGMCHVEKETLQELIEVRNLRNANMNPFLAVTSTPYRIYYLQGYCAKGTLASILGKKKVHLDRLFKLSFAIDIANGMNYLHNSPIRSHGRLSSESVYIDSRWFCRIGDIPLPKFESSGEGHVSVDLGAGLGGALNKSVSTKKQHHYSVKGSGSEDDAKTKEIKGTLWTAPELLRCPPPTIRGTQKGDVYSYGIILQEIILRSKPFGMYDLPEELMLKKVVKSGFPQFRPRLPQDDEEVGDLCDLSKYCWEEFPGLRPTFNSISQILLRSNNGKQTNLIDQMLKMMQNHTDKLEDQVAERTAALGEEKKKSEDLLSRMLPRYVCEELKAGRLVEPESYTLVTLYFSDIVGFSALATESTALEIVDFLNDLYSEFDNIIDSYDVYKVETISDAYMVCSGLPIRNGTLHASEIASMALDMMSSVTRFKIRHRPNKTLQLRCGIHTGPVVAGVVGNKMPRYCLFGDTVNYASRMESSCLALRIQASPECKQVLDQLGGFHLVERGFVQVKGKGEIKTYFLVGKDGFNKQMPSLDLAAALAEHEFK